MLEQQRMTDQFFPLKMHRFNVFFLALFEKSLAFFSAPSVSFVRIFFPEQDFYKSVLFNCFSITCIMAIYLHVLYPCTFGSPPAAAVASNQLYSCDSLPLGKGQNK